MWIRAIHPQLLEAPCKSVGYRKTDKAQGGEDKISKERKWIRGQRTGKYGARRINIGIVIRVSVAIIQIVGAAKDVKRAGRRGSRENSIHRVKNRTKP